MIIKKILYSTLFLFSLLSIFGCADIFLPSDKENSPVQNFELLWDDFDKTYSFFEYKKINWDSLHAVYRPQINDQTTETQLFEICSSMLDHLKDGHVNIYSTLKTYSYTGWYDKYPTNYLSNNITKYVKNYKISGALQYGNINDSIGYIYIPSFSNNKNYSAIDNIIQQLNTCKGIIIDIRNNGGGSDINCITIASRFMKEKKLFRYTQWRNGPKHSDFSEKFPDYIEPDGSFQFTKPIALLTNRKCFSSAEGFLLMMKTMPYVTVIGDTSGGGSANPIFRELPNGWVYRIPRWIEYSSAMTTFEGTGISPDIPVWINAEDSLAGKDTILETAIQFLKEK